MKTDEEKVVETECDEKVEAEEKEEVETMDCSSCSLRKDVLVKFCLALRNILDTEDFMEPCVLIEGALLGPGSAGRRRAQRYGVSQ